MKVDFSESMFDENHLHSFMNGNVTPKGKTSHPRILEEWANRLYSDHKIYQEMINRFDSLKCFGTKQRKALIAMYKDDKDIMPKWLTKIIEQKYSEFKNSEFVCLLFLWSIYGQELMERELAFLPQLTGNSGFSASALPKLKAKAYRCSPVFIPRDHILDDIQAKLDQKEHYVFVQGMGELVKQRLLSSTLKSM